MGEKNYSDVHLKQIHQEKAMPLEKSLLAETNPQALLRTFTGKNLHHFNTSVIQNNQCYCP